VPLSAAGCASWDLASVFLSLLFLFFCFSHFRFLTAFIRMADNSVAEKDRGAKITIRAPYAHSAKSGAIELATRRLSRSAAASLIRSRRSSREMGRRWKKAQLAADTAGFTWQNSMHLNARTTAPNDSLFARAGTHVALSPRNLPGRPSSTYPRSNPNHRWNLHSAHQVNYEVSVTTQLHYDYCTILASNSR